MDSLPPKLRIVEGHLGRNFLLCHPQKPPPIDLCLPKSGRSAWLHPLWLDGKVLMLHSPIGLQENCISQEGAPLPGQIQPDGHLSQRLFSPVTSSSLGAPRSLLFLGTLSMAGLSDGPQLGPFYTIRIKALPH